MGFEASLLLLQPYPGQWILIMGDWKACLLRYSYRRVAFQAGMVLDLSGFSGADLVENNHVQVPWPPGYVVVRV